MDNRTSKILVSAAIAGVMGAFTMNVSFGDDSAPPAGGAAPAKAAPMKVSKNDLGKCWGANGCKGKSECSVPNANQCSGKNECGGKGWVKMTNAKCTKWSKKAKKEMKWDKM